MSFYRPYGKLANGYVVLTSAATGPTPVITPGSDEWVDVYNIIIPYKSYFKVKTKRFPIKIFILRSICFKVNEK